MNKHLSEIQIEESDKQCMEPYYQFLIKYQDTKNYIQALFDEILSNVKGLKQNLSNKSVLEQRDYVKQGFIVLDLQEYSDKLDQLRNFQYQKSKNHFRINYLEKFQVKVKEMEVFKCKEHDEPYTKICLLKHPADLKHLYCDQCVILQDCIVEKFVNTNNFVFKILREQFQDMKQHIDTQIQFLYRRIVAEEDKINNSIMNLGQFETIKLFIKQEEPFQQYEHLQKEINQLKNFRFQYSTEEQQKKILQKVERLKFDVNFSDQTIEIQDIYPKFDVIEYNSQLYNHKQKIIIQNNTKEVTMFQNQGQGILVPTQVNYRYKYIHQQINQQTNIICQNCQKKDASNISIEKQIILLLCEYCSYQSKSKLIFEVDDVSKYINSIQTLIQGQKVQKQDQQQDQQQDQEYQQLELPYKNDGAFELFCQKQDHFQNKIYAICQSNSCDQVDFRLCCEICFQSHQHKGINEVKTIRAFLFDQYLDWYNLIERMVSIDDKVKNFTQNINKSILDYLKWIYNQRNLDFNQPDNYFEMNNKLKTFFDQQKNQEIKYKIQHSEKAFLFQKPFQIIIDLNQKLSSINLGNDNKPQMIELLHYISSSDNVPKINKFEKGILGHQICLKSTKSCKIDQIVLPQYSPKIDLTLVLSLKNCDIIINQIKAGRNLSSSSIESIGSQNKSQLKSQQRKDKVLIKLEKPLYLLAGMVYKLRILPCNEQPWQMEEYRQVIDTDHQSILSQIRPDDKLTEQDNKFIIRQFIVQCQVLIL